VESAAKASPRLDLDLPGRTGNAAGFQPTMTQLADIPPVQPDRLTRVPRTEAERQQVLLARDIGWEYFYFAGQLLYERDSVEAKYRNREIHYAVPSREAVTGEVIAGYIEYTGQRFGDLASFTRVISGIINVNDKVAMERAFGAPFQEGDPERLAHLAKRWNSVYEGFLDWAAGLRGINAPSELQNLLELAARCVDVPLEKYRRFVDQYVAQVEILPAAIAAGEPLRIEASLILPNPDEDLKNYQTELNRLRSRLSRIDGQ
jgi:hypothetical protein